LNEAQFDCAKRVPFPMNFSNPDDREHLAPGSHGDALPDAVSID
jgi:hypothetical protein